MSNRESNFSGYPYAACRPLEFGSVRLTEGFWSRTAEQSRSQGLPALLSEYENRNVVGNFVAAAAGQPRAKEENASNYDEFLFKALEACNYHIGISADKRLSEQYERIRDIVLAAQEPDGYLNTISRQTGIPRYSEESRQELYAGGHLMQAGIAERRMTGKDTLYIAAKRYIDCLIQGFGIDGSRLTRRFGRFKWPDHPNVELALVELYRETGDTKYLEFCNAILHHDEYRNRTQMTNHAVQELLHAAGGADYYLETGDREVWDATIRLWNDLLKKVYITGGVGSTHRGPTRESVGKEHALTNDQAYTETCAAISLVFWSWRMFLATAEGSFIDMLERTLYNGVLGGLSADGCEYFYENPLEYRVVSAAGSAATEDQFTDFRGDSYPRKAFHGCSCCPPNVQRLLASVQSYIYSVSESRLFVNMYVASQAGVRLDTGTQVSITQKTAYPWRGGTSIEISLEKSATFSLMLRIPEWCPAVTVKVNGESPDPVSATRNVIEGVSKGFFEIRREWSDGDIVAVGLEMVPRFVQSHPKNIANYEKLVIAKGPLVYCLEGIDNPDIDIFSVVVAIPTEFKEHDGSGTKQQSTQTSGPVTLEFEAYLRDDAVWDKTPYQTLDTDSTPGDLTGRLTPVSVKAIPYYTWANRGRSSMVTALRYLRTSTE